MESEGNGGPVARLNKNKEIAMWPVPLLAPIGIPAILLVVFLGYYLARFLSSRMLGHGSHNAGEEFATTMIGILPTIAIIELYVIALVRCFSE